MIIIRWSDIVKSYIYKGHQFIDKPEQISPNSYGVSAEISSSVYGDQLKSPISAKFLLFRCGFGTRFKAVKIEYHSILGIHKIF